MASRTTLATGVGPAAALLQDATALHWGPSATNRIYRIAKQALFAPHPSVIPIKLFRSGPKPCVGGRTKLV